jgi:cell division protein FtsW
VDTGRALCDIEPLDVEDPVNRTMHNGFFVEQIREHRTRVDTTLAGIILLLVVVGLGMLLSASWFRAEQLYGDPLRFVMRQGMWVGVGIIGLILAYVMPLERVRKALPFLVLVTIVLSLLTFLPGVSARYMGARRWIIVFNVSFQPSELVKVVLVIYLAHILSRSGGDFSRPLQSLLPPAVIVSLFAVIVLRQNDYSTSVFLVLVALAMFFVAGVPTTHFVRIFVLVMPISLILLFTREHRVRRIIAFLNPEFDPAGSGFQVLAARRALENGGPWGAGIGRGLRKMGGLPEAQSDFIFAVLGEELGFIGVFLIIVLFLLLALRGFSLARRQSDGFRFLLLYGFTFSISVQAMLNMAVVAGLVPATGIPLPFFSSGGSSLVATMVMCGLMFNAAGRAPEREPQPWERTHV